MRVLALFVVCAAVAGCGRHGTRTLVVRHGATPAWMLPRARIAARALGDPHPRKIDLYGRGRNYEIRLWGHFTCRVCSHPPDAGPITGEVATYVYRGHSRALGGFALGPGELARVADLVAPVVREWRAALVKGARIDPRARFASPPVGILRARLRRAARRYGFTVELVLLRRPKQLAPQVVIRSRRRVHLAHEIGPIMDAIDPPHSNHRAYEGILIEAIGDDGVPYAVAFNALRGGVVGGQWAGAPNLYPFAHG